MHFVMDFEPSSPWSPRSLQTLDLAHVGRREDMDMTHMRNRIGTGCQLPGRQPVPHEMSMTQEQLHRPPSRPGVDVVRWKHPLPLTRLHPPILEQLLTLGIEA